MAGVALRRSMRSAGAVAARCAARLAGRIVPDFQGRFGWSTEGLVVSSSGSATAVVLNPGEWWLRLSHGLAEAMPSLIAPVTALAVLAAAVLDALPTTLGGRLVGSTDGLVARGPDSAPGEWLGFLQLRSGWIGVVTVGEQAAARLDLALGAGSIASRDAVAAATYLQTLGIAALPARTALPRRRPVQDEQRSSLPVLSWEGCEGGLAILTGRRIVDLGRVVAGPFAGRLLESLGATVHRLRPPKEGKRWGVEGEEVDLRRPNGIARLRELLGPADLVVENYRPRAWDQLIHPIGGRAGPPPARPARVPRLFSVPQLEGLWVPRRSRVRRRAMPGPGRSRLNSGRSGSSVGSSHRRGGRSGRGGGAGDGPNPHGGFADPIGKRTDAGAGGVDPCSLNGLASGLRCITMAATGRSFWPDRTATMRWTNSCGTSSS